MDVRKKNLLLAALLAAIALGLYLLSIYKAIFPSNP